MNVSVVFVEQGFQRIPMEKWGPWNSDETNVRPMDLIEGLRRV